MGVEIERRFLITDKDTVSKLIEEYKSTKKTIIQDYIYSDAMTAIRKRKIITESFEKYIYTVKTGRKKISVNEFEEEISKEEYDSIRKNPDRYTIEKDRYVIPYTSNLAIELDIFHGKYEGLVFAEIEFPNEEQAKVTKMPNWFGTEIGGIISNNKLSMGIDNVSKFIEENI